MILGLTSYTGAGKGAIGAYLVSKFGFTSYVLSDILRESVKAQGIEPNVLNLTKEGERLRALEGPGVLAARTLLKMQPGKDYVVDSIRAPEEVMKLKERPDFYLISVYASADVRFQRISSRNRPGDPKTLADLMALDARQANNPSPGGMKIERCMNLADYRINNERLALVELQRSVDDILYDVRLQHP